MEALLVENEATLVDQDPTHYILNLPSEDPRRFSDDSCVVCGLLAEYHGRTADQVAVWSPEYRKCHYQTVCGPRCRERFLIMMESLERETNDAAGADM